LKKPDEVADEERLLEVSVGAARPRLLPDPRAAEGSDQHDRKVGVAASCTCDDVHSAKVWHLLVDDDGIDRLRVQLAERVNGIGMYDRLESFSPECRSQQRSKDRIVIDDHDSTGHREDIAATSMPAAAAAVGDVSAPRARGRGRHDGVRRNDVARAPARGRRRRGAATRAGGDTTSRGDILATAGRSREGTSVAPRTAVLLMLVFAVSLLVAVPLPSLAQRTLLSAAAFRWAEIDDAALEGSQA
jgi:hypothetical protein